MAPFLPYVYGLLRARAEEDLEVRAAYRFREPIFLSKPAQTVVEELREPAVLGLSCYVWNFQKHMKIARLCKQRFPKALVVAGGPQIPDRVGNFFREHPYVDILVHGEGELSFQLLLKENLFQRPNWSLVPSVSFLEQEKAITTPRPLSQRTIEGRSPYLQGYLDKSIELCRGLKLDFTAPWETNRGCPYSCSFCDWGSDTLSKIRSFHIDRLNREIDFFGRSQIPNVHINDANFGILDRDLSIAQHLLKSREIHGFPKNVQLNFAKNSNERVVEISRLWTTKGMLSSTTLSMQAANAEVLRAIDRENIGIDRYIDLQERYRRSNMQTYTELILGLPKETRQSFKEGVARVLDMGNHDDIRVYELAILPNAPINNKETIERYGLTVITKHLFPLGHLVPEDEIETVPTVIETNSLSKSDWVSCFVFARLIQFLHGGCFTRYVAMHLRRSYELPYHNFYDRLQSYFLDRPDDTVLGGVLSAIQNLYREFQEGPNIPTIDANRSPIQALPLLKQRAFVTLIEWAWLCISSQNSRFYNELGQFLRTLPIVLDEEIDQLLLFQQEIMLQLDYDPVEGKLCAYDYNFPGYFMNNEPLRKQANLVHYHDKALGRQLEYALEKGNVRRFLDAALGTKFSDVSCRYQHQWEAATIHVDARANTSQSIFRLKTSH